MQSSLDFSKYSGINALTVRQAAEHTKIFIDTIGDEGLALLTQGSSKDITGVISVILDEAINLFKVDSVKAKSGGFGFPDKLADAAHEFFKKTSLVYFCLSSIPDFLIGKHHFEWSALMENHKRLCVIAPRDHGKSFFFTVMQAIWRLYRYTPQNIFGTVPNDWVLSGNGYVINRTHGIAQVLMETAKKIIDGNPALTERLKRGSNIVWNNDKIVCSNGASFFTASFLSAVRGLHVGWVTADDYLGSEIISSKTMAEKYSTFFKEDVMPTCVPGGQIIFVGTPFTKMDMFAGFKENEEWTVAEYPAIFPNGEILWKERYDFKALMSKRVELGETGFSREFLVKPVSSESTLFPNKYTERAFFGSDLDIVCNSRFDMTRNFKKISVGCDFAFSANIGADYTVYTVLGEDYQDRIWLIYQYRDKGLSFDTQISKLSYINDAFTPDVFFIESNQAQSVFADGAKELGLPVIAKQTGAEKHTFEKGIPKIAILFERGLIGLPTGNDESKMISNGIVNEFTQFTWADDGGVVSIGEHDDQAMSFWLAWRGLSEKSGELKAYYADFSN